MRIIINGKPAIVAGKFYRASMFQVGKFVECTQIFYIHEKMFVEYETLPPYQVVICGQDWINPDDISDKMRPFYDEDGDIIKLP